MSTFKCKMCGGALEIADGATVVECAYCGTQQTLPKLNDDRRANMYDRANHFRRNNEFDKAMGIYEQILNEDITDAEAYWSLVLCRYGIEYVEDPSTHKRVPTVHRAQYTSIFDDDNYQFALKNADTYQKVIYEEEARAINEIQKGILAISQKEEPFDVFICYKETDDSGRRTPDSVLAQELYYQLKQEGFKIFFSRITLEDKLGSAYEPYIFAALHSAKVMVVIGTKTEYYNAVWVKNEWSRFLSLIKNGEKKMLIPAYKGMDPYDLPKEFSHLQAQDMSKLGFMQDLIRGIKKIIGREQKPTAAAMEPTAVRLEGRAQDTTPLLRRAALFLEDGEYDAADEYAERVLDHDPECAEAYIVKLLIELHLKKESDLAQWHTPLDDSHNYQRALRFASPSYREKIEGYNDAIIKRIESARQEEVYVRGEEFMRSYRYDQAIECFKKISTFRDAAQKISECQRQAETERLERVYRRAKQYMGNSLFTEASHLFETIAEYKDSREKIKTCAEKAEAARKEEIYLRAIRRVESPSATDLAIKKSIEEFQSIVGYRDAADKIRELTVRLEKWYEDKRIAEEAARIRAEKVKATTKGIAKFGIPSAIALTVVLILIFNLIIPLSRYNTADELFNAGKYDEAEEIYGGLDGFSDSEQRITLLNGIEMINGADFVRGIEKILSVGVPVKLVYGMNGGDFSGAAYMSEPREGDRGGVALFSAAASSSAALTVDTPEVTEFTYDLSAEFGGLETPGRNGYCFVRWVLEKYSYQIGGVFELKLNAVWSIKNYTILYNLNGGTISEKNITEYDVEDRTFALLNPTREGYTFTGWIGTGLAEPTLNVTIPSGSYGDRTYTATWQENQ